MHTAFKTPSTHLITAQPTGEKLIIRSTASGDSDVLSLVGLVSSVSTAENIAMDFWSDATIEQETTNQFDSLTAVLYAGTTLGAISIYGQGTKANGSIVVLSLPANNDTLKVGLLGQEQTYTFKTSLTGADQIKIAATPALQATYIYEALNHGANIGTDYGNSTVANVWVEAPTAPSTATCLIRDRLACARATAWSVSQTVGATLAIAPLVGGVDGTLLARLAASLVAPQLFNPFTLSSENLTTKTLPALVTPTTDAILVNGKMCTIRLRCENVVSAIASKYQTSTDGIHWIDGIRSIANMDNNTQFVSPSELNVEKIRWVCTSNPNTTDSAVDVQLIQPLV